MHTQLNEALIQLKLENYNSSSNLNMVLEVITNKNPKSKVIYLSQQEMETEKENFVKHLVNNTLSMFKRRRSA